MSHEYRGTLNIITKFIYKKRKGEGYEPSKLLRFDGEYMIELMANIIVMVKMQIKIDLYFQKSVGMIT